jgi:hypothetical protein
MVNLTRASEELFRRRPDERFASLDDLYRHCSESKQTSSDRWCLPGEIAVHPAQGGLQLSTMGERLGMNDWSFSQACTLARVSKDTVNRLSPETAARVFAETWPGGTKPMQVYTEGQSVRSIHGASYTRLHNIELCRWSANSQGFRAAQQAIALAGDRTTPGKGLYCGEQDMFWFLIDPTGWTEIDGEAFAPGFFLWNSEVGRRTVGIQTFWFQAVCQNHIVWDAVDVVEFSRKHTANVHEALAEVRQLIERLVTKREPTSATASCRSSTRCEHSIRRGPRTRPVKVLGRHGIPRKSGHQRPGTGSQVRSVVHLSVVPPLTEMVSRYRGRRDRTTLGHQDSLLLSLAPDPEL